MSHLTHNRIANISKYITNWFHTADTDEDSASYALHIVLNKFFNNCDRFKLSLALSEQHARRSLSNALCTMYHAYIFNKDWKGPTVKFTRPLHWTSELNGMWIDYIHTHHFSDEYWTAFWEDVPECPLDNQLPNWRANMQYILPLYVYCDIEQLVCAGIIHEEEDGNVGAWETYEPSEEDSYWT